MINAVFFVSLLCFFIGIMLGFTNSRIKLPHFINKFLTGAILFLIGVKGGGAIFENGNFVTPHFYLVFGLVVIWGFLQPFLSFYLLKRFTRVDFNTAAAISASFGSVSLMTFVAGVSFLDSLQISYKEVVIGVLAIMEIPAIISGLLIAKKFTNTEISSKQLIFHAIFNQPIAILVVSIFVGALMQQFEWIAMKKSLLPLFNPILALFLFDMGGRIGRAKNDFKNISKGLISFGFYMPLIGGFFALLCSYFLKLDVGTATLLIILSASASYIAVPAAMRLALPEAKESIYLPLSLGITFPFNLIFGIPFYYYLANWALT
jgi:hypothetical protein